MHRRRWAPAVVTATLFLVGAAAAQAQVSASGSNQSYHTNDPTTSAPTFTINCLGGIWTSGNGVRLIIPQGLAFSWDTSVTGLQVSYSGLNSGNMTTPPAVS